MPTAWTTEAFRPTQLSHILPAGFLSTEPFLELENRPWIILHAHILHLVVTGVKRIAPILYKPSETEVALAGLGREFLRLYFARPRPNIKGSEIPFVVPLRGCTKSAIEQFGTSRYPLQASQHRLVVQFSKGIVMKVQRKSYATDITDEQWEKIAPWIPWAKPGGRNRKTSMRESGQRSVLRAAYRLRMADASA